MKSLVDLVRFGSLTWVKDHLKITMLITCTARSNISSDQPIFKKQGRSQNNQQGTNNDSLNTIFSREKRAMPSICPLPFGHHTHHLSVKALHNLHNTPDAADKDQMGNARPLVKSAVKGCATGAAALVGCLVSYQKKLSSWPFLYCWPYPLPSPPLPMRFKLCSVISVPPYLLPTKHPSSRENTSVF